MRHQAGQTWADLLSVLEDCQPPVVGGQPLLDVSQTEYSQGIHIVSVAPQALGGGQTMVGEVTVDNNNLDVGVLQLICDPCL